MSVGVCLQRSSKLCKRKMWLDKLVEIDDGKSKARFFLSFQNELNLLQRFSKCFKRVNVVVVAGKVVHSK